MGVMNTDNNGSPAQMIFNENPNVSGSYSEFQQGNIPGERRVLYSTDSYDLKPGESKCYHFAIVYTRELQNNHIENVNSLMAMADQIQVFFDSDIDPTCYVKPTLSVEENGTSLNKEISVYPNPAKNFVVVESTQDLSTLIILDRTGREIEKIENPTSKNHLSTESWAQGFYIIEAVMTNGTVIKKRFIKN
jgi:hypothetical protein